MPGQRPEVCYLQARAYRRDSGGDGQAGNHGLVGSTQPEDIEYFQIFDISALSSSGCITVNILISPTFNNCNP